jgi:hypothetical protein
MGKQPEALAKFSGQEIADGCIAIAAHNIIGLKWNRYFSTQQAAAISWLTYKYRYSERTIEQWFGQFDKSVLPPQRERRWTI